MKKFCFIACALSILLFLGNHIITLQTPTFLAVPYLTEQEALAKVSALSPVDDRSIAHLVRFEDTPLFYDATTATHTITVGEEQAGNFETRTSIQLYWLSTTNAETLDTAIANNEPLLLLAIYNGSYEVISLRVSSLPLVSFDTIEAGQQITIVEPDDPETNRYTTTTSMMIYAIRGATSATFDKKPYKVSLLEKDGDRNPLSLFGMRTDDDWNFNAVYGDISRIREAASLDLLQQVADTAEDPHSHPQDGQFCELFIDNHYYGIYQVLEPMDTRQAEIDQGSDYLYKVGQHFTFDESFYALNELEDDQYSPVPVKSYPKKEHDTRYDPLIDYLLFLQGQGEGDITIQESTLAEIGTVLDLENLIDLSIVNTTLSLSDNNGKNAMIVLEAQADGSLLARREYFDFNYSLGDTWCPPDTAGTIAYTRAADPSEISTDDLFDLFVGAACYPELIALYQERYAALRETVLSEENILATAAPYYNELNASGAYLRDAKRWNTPTTAEADYARLTAYVPAHLLAVDEYVAQLG